METNTYNLLDTIVKIGLGAIIAGLFSYIGIILNFRKEKKLRINERKVKSLEEVKLMAFNYIYRVKNLMSVVVANSIEELSNKLGDIDFMEDAIEMDDKINEIDKETNFTLYELKLLGLNHIAEDFIKIINFQKIYSYAILEGEIKIPEDDVFDVAENFSEIIDGFIKNLSKYYFN